MASGKRCSVISFLDLGHILKGRLKVPRLSDSAQTARQNIVSLGAAGEMRSARPAWKRPKRVPNLRAGAVSLTSHCGYRIEIGRVSLFLFLLFLMASGVGIFRTEISNELRRLMKLRRRRSNAVSRPISVEAVSDKDAGAEYYKKPC